VTPRMRILLTCSMSRHGAGGLANFPRLPRALITISFVFPQFNVSLFCTAQSPICSISLHRLLEFAAGTSRYVSSAYLNMRFPVVHGCRSAAVTTYSAGPSPEPCITQIVSHNSKSDKQYVQRSRKRSLPTISGLIDFVI